MAAMNRREMIRRAGLGVVATTLLPASGVAESNALHLPRPADAGAAPAYTPALSQEAEILLNLGEVFVIGESTGGRRSWAQITGGTCRLSDTKGTVTDGMYREVIRADDITEVMISFVFTVDGEKSVVEVESDGLIGVPDTNSGNFSYGRTSVSFRAPEGRLEWLNKYIFLSELSKPENGEVSLKVFRMG